MPTKRLDTLPRTKRFAKLDWPAAGMTPKMASALVTRPSCLLFQFCRIEAFSFLPDLQCNGRNLARQSQARHRGVHPAGQQILIELSQRIILRGAGLRGRTLEEILQIMIMVDVEAAQRRWFPRMLQLSPGVPVFAAAPCPQAQPAVVPKLAFRTETMRCLNERDQKGDADRAQPGNLFEKLTSGMLPAFRQQLLPRFLPYPHQKVELLISLLSPTAHAGFPQFLQPGGAMARRIDLLAGAGNRPTPIDRLETIHHAREVFAGGEIAATQFPQGADPGLSVIHRREKSRAKQVAQFACIHPIVLIAGFQQRVLPRIAYDHIAHVGLEQVVQPGCTGPFLEGYR